MNNFWIGKRIVVTGGAGFLGSRVVNELIRRGADRKQITIPRSREFDLRTAAGARRAVSGADIVIHLAGNVGGIGFNRKHPGRVFFDNAAMALHVIEESRLAGVKKFVGIGSVCAYPKFAPTPFREETLWDGYPEETNAAYGLAKKMMLVQSQAYAAEYGFPAIHLLMVNLYGPGDNFDPEQSHVIPALIRKIGEAKRGGTPLVVWGTGTASREFLFVDDAAEGIVLAAERYEGFEPVNLGSGEEISIRDLVATIARLMDYRGEIQWDATKPDGQPRRLLDVTRAKKIFGFSAKTPLEDGLRKTIHWYEMNR